jgi:hypothetical protein
MITTQEQKEIIEKGGFFCRTVCELVGSPKEHIEKTAKLMIEKAEEVRDSQLIEHEIAEVVPRGTMFSTFIEMQILFKKKEALMGFCFDFMPSSVEILEPEKFEIENNLFSSWINELQGRLHQIDMVAKEKSALVRLYDKNQAVLLRYNMLSHLKDTSRTTEDLRMRIGVDKNTFEKYLNALKERKEILEDGDKLKLGPDVRFDDVREEQS